LDRLLDGVAVVAVCLIALRLGLDHAAWVAADRTPVLDEDSEFHAVRFIREYRHLLADPGFRTLVPAGNYPPLVEWVTWLGFARDGVTAVGLRNAQVPFTSLLSLATALLAWRAWGRAAAVAAAALCVVYPPLWPQRSNVMLMVPVAATTAAAYATLPIPGVDRRAGAAALGGVALGAALLTHVSAVYFVAPLIAFVVVRAAWVGRRKAARGAAFGSAAVWLGVAALVAAPWWLPSVLTVSGIVGNHWGRAPEGLDLYGRLYFVMRLKEVYLPGPQYWAVLAGLPISLILAWRRPMVVVTLLTLFAGFAGLLTFPQSHDRYFLPLVALLTVVAAAPLGLLAWPGPLRRVREVLALALAGVAVGYGLRFSAASLRPDAPTLRGYGQIVSDLDLVSVFPPGLSPEQRERGDRVVIAALQTPPRWWIVAGPRPEPDGIPDRALTDILAADLPRWTPGGEAGSLLQLDPQLPLTRVVVELAVRDAPELTVVAPHSAPGAAIDLTCDRRPCYAVGDTADARLLARLAATGFTLLGSTPMTRPAQRGTTTLGVWRR
jgi:hypothetical protein